ncbi:hypothetical protein [Pendulispora albinea]|uniref:Uncharacterized protein n=1 Tax=Pendulispora albinea TaxID=2741071 RepID=A0ABZ2M6E3_9BACT
MTQPPHDLGAEPRVAFDVIDVLGLCTLEKRSPTLDGSVPLRVAQACMPLLEGNAFGFQIALRKRIELRRRLGAFHLSSFEDEPAYAREHRATLPMAVARGLLVRGGVWHERLERGIVDAGHFARRSTGSAVAFWTGLLVRPRAGVRLRQSSTANRRAVTFTVDEVILDDTDAYCPLVLGIAPADDTDTVVLHGEIATLAALPARARLECVPLDEAPEVARAHLAFYDAHYFATKREHPSRKYKHLATRAPSPAESAADLHVRAACAGPATVFEACPRQIAGAKGPRPEPYAPDRFVFRNAVAFSARFDGQHVAIDFDRARLAAHAERIRAAWTGVLGAGDEGVHQGALWYLTKYFTPHPAGEPHFFVKPWALMHTRAGCSMLLEGIPGRGYDVLRGVVRTDVFHATPAVFALRQPGLHIDVAEGAPLLSLLPIPRALEQATFHLEGFRDAFA